MKIFKWKCGGLTKQPRYSLREEILLCRAFLSPYKGEVNNIEGQYKWWGRFNMGLTSINLADAGLSA